MMIKKYVLVIPLALAALAAINPELMASDISIASVDMHQIMEAHPAFLQAQAEYQNRMQEMQAQLSDMSDEERMMAQQMMQQELQTLGNRLQSDATEVINRDISGVASSKGYDYVLDSSVLIVGGDDITEAVLIAIRE